MFNIKELTILLELLTNRATFNVSGQEAETIIILKNRILEEINKLQKTNEKIKEKTNEKK